MATRFSIPVFGNALGTHVRVEIAVTTDGVNPPAENSTSWFTLAVIDNDDLPTSVVSPFIPEGDFLWHRGSAEEDGNRVSAYTTPQVAESPLLPGFITVGLAPGDPSPHTVTWTPNAEAGGVLVEWAIEEPSALEPTYGDSAEVDGADGSYVITDNLPDGFRLYVRLTAYETFGGGSVSGDSGNPVVLFHEDPGDPDADDVLDPLEGLDCRIIFDSSLELVVDSDYCLVLTNP